MKVFEQIQQLQQIHKLIAAGQTGTPKDFARKLGISPRRWYDILDELKSRGAPIAYSHLDKTYFYKEAGFVMDLACHFKHLTPAEEENNIKFFAHCLFCAVNTAYICI